MSHTKLPKVPLQILAADLLGPLPSGDYIFVLVDFYSRWFEIEVTKTEIHIFCRKYLLHMDFDIRFKPITVLNLLVSSFGNIWRKMVLSIDEQLLCGHKSMEKLRDRIGH